MHTQPPATGQPALTLQELRTRLDELVHVCDLLADRFERERDQAACRRDSREVGGLQQALLQVARVRNEVHSARRDLEAIASPGPSPNRPLAAQEASTAF